MSLSALKLEGMHLPLTQNTQTNRSLTYKYGAAFLRTPHYRACTRTWAVMTRDANTCARSRMRAKQIMWQPRYIRRTGMNTPVVVSKELRNCIGGNDITNRSQILADLSKYIRENNLYVDGESKRVLCDERLSSLLNVVGEVDFWDLFRRLKPHLTDPSDLGPEYESRAIKFFEKYLKQRGALASWLAPPRRKDPRGANSAAAQRQLRKHRQGMFAEVHIEPCLRPLCDGKSRLPRPEVLKSVWVFIKKNNLQVATNRRRIRVTETLRDALRLPNVEWIDSFRLGSYVFKLTSKREQ